jgi:hypothetical protein
MKITEKALVKQGMPADEKPRQRLKSRKNSQFYGKVDCRNHHVWLQAVSVPDGRYALTCQ